jgi:hypothetical protein
VLLKDFLCLTDTTERGMESQEVSSGKLTSFGESNLFPLSPLVVVNRFSSHPSQDADRCITGGELPHAKRNQGPGSMSSQPSGRHQPRFGDLVASFPAPFLMGCQAMIQCATRNNLECRGILLSTTTFSHEPSAGINSQGAVSFTATIGRRAVAMFSGFSSIRRTKRSKCRRP